MDGLPPLNTPALKQSCRRAEQSLTSQIDGMFGKVKQLKDKQMLAVFLEDMRLIKGIVAKWNGRMDDILLGEGKENGRRIFQSTTSEIIDAHSQVGRPQCEAAAPQATVEASPQSVDARVLHHAVNSPATAPGNARDKRARLSPARTPEVGRAARSPFSQQPRGARDNSTGGRRSSASINPSPPFGLKQRLQHDPHSSAKPRSATKYEHLDREEENQAGLELLRFPPSFRYGQAAEELNAVWGEFRGEQDGRRRVMAMEHLKRRLPSIGLEKLTLLVELLESRGFLRSYLGDGQIFWERVVRRPRH